MTIIEVLEVVEHTVDNHALDANNNLQEFHRSPEWSMYWKGQADICDTIATYIHDLRQKREVELILRRPAKRRQRS